MKSSLPREFLEHKKGYGRTLTSYKFVERERRYYYSFVIRDSQNEHQHMN